jgi:rubredoxin
MTQQAANPVAPAACPDCRSDQIKAPDQPGDGLSYWRCLKCGVVWNPERPRDRDLQSRPQRTTHSNYSGDYWHNK